MELAKKNLITPYLTIPLAYKHEELFASSTNQLWGRMKIDWDGAYQEPVLNLPADGKFKKPLPFSFLRINPTTSVLEKITVELKEFILDPKLSLAEKISTLTPYQPQPPSVKKVVAKEDDKTPDIWYYIAMGLIGGFILNLMPCVFPIITLKLFELLQQREDSPGRIVRHNLFYSFGILSSFLALASVILVLKKGGETIGWGFHLQSPLFVSAMVIIIFTMTLNLFGLFELRTPGGSILGSVKLRESFFGDFFGGVIATILSTPCSAPFLGTALTFAFAATSIQTIIVFLATGVGLASPFLATALFPELIRMLPRPGHWMNLIKKLMGLSLILTIAWLADIFYNQTDLHAVKILGAILFTIFICVIIRKNVLHRNKRTLIIFLIPLAAYIWMGQELKKITPVTSHSILESKQKEGLAWEMWSEARVKELQSQGETVFIDFTAKWCFTCKMNEKLVLDTDGFKEVVKEKKIKLLLADWTNHDQVIGEFLKNQNLIGIPAYFIAKPNGELIFLGETLTLDKIKSKL
jgi:thiol:disulfide interchange protein DsbD